MNYLFALLLISIFRAADLYLTWRITPDLKYELNPIVRRLRWRTIIWMNIAICILTSFVPWPFLLAGCVISALAIAWNVRILWKISKNKV